MNAVIRNIQSGAILMTSLILLLVMTLIGLSAMRSTTLEERLSGNARNTETAFQASEAALREGESWVLGLLSEPDASVDGISSVWALDAPDPNIANSIAWWQEYAIDATWWNSNGTAFSSVLSGIGAMPRYLIEEAGFVKDTLNLGQQQDETGRTFYRVTAYGIGGNDLARVLLQSTFARRY